MPKTPENCINNTEDKNINVTVEEVILTPLACASIVIEIIRCLVYQKSQIPYPYKWLKSVINRRRERAETDTSVSLTIEQHYRTVSSAYDALEELATNLYLEFKTCGEDIKQVAIIFGANVYHPKEVFQINITGLAVQHLEDNHAYTNSKNQYKILKNIVFAQEWIKAMDILIPPTNMYVLLQKASSNSNDQKTAFFEQNTDYTLPARVTATTINLNYNNIRDYNCCSNLLIFKDATKEQHHSGTSVEIDSSLNDSLFRDNSSVSWYEAKVSMKGFKEFFINNVSATELW